MSPRRREAYGCPPEGASKAGLSPIASSVLGLLVLAAVAPLVSGQVPGQPLQSETCNSELNANYNGTLLNNQTADNLGDCCYRCQKYPGCNIYVFCPSLNGCDNGYGINVNFRECNLKWQNLNSNNLSSIAVWSRGSATTFSSGQTGPLRPFPPPSSSGPGIAPIVAPAPGVGTILVHSGSSGSSKAGAIAGGVVGGLAGATLIVLTAGCYFRWWTCGRQRQSDAEAGQKDSLQNPFDPDLQKKISREGNTELAEFHAAIKAGTGRMSQSQSSSAVSSGAASLGKVERPRESGGNPQGRSEPQKRHGSGDLVSTQPEETQALSLQGSGMLEAGVLLQQVGPQSRQATVGVAFEDEAAATLLAGEDLQETWKIDPKDLQIKMKGGLPVKLGQGGCGSVYLGVLYGMREVAIKVINNPDERQQARFMREIMMLKACHDPNIVQFLGAAVHREQTLLVMTYMPGGDLYQQLAKDSAGDLRWKRRGKSIALDIIKGLSFLHRHQIMHLDVKSPNILLTESWEARIADVGLGKRITEDGSIATQGASYMWAAPEQLLGEPCSTASDIYSLGVVIWELCTGEQPHRRQCRPVLLSEAPQAVGDIVNRCRSLDPAARPTISEVYREIINA